MIVDRETKLPMLMSASLMLFQHLSLKSTIKKRHSCRYKKRSSLGELLRLRRCRLRLTTLPPQCDAPQGFYSIRTKFLIEQKKGNLLFQKISSVVSFILLLRILPDFWVYLRHSLFPLPHSMQTAAWAVHCKSS